MFLVIWVFSLNIPIFFDNWQFQKATFSPVMRPVFEILHRYSADPVDCGFGCMILKRTTEHTTSVQVGAKCHLNAEHIQHSGRA